MHTRTHTHTQLAVFVFAAPKVSPEAFHAFHSPTILTSLFSNYALIAFNLYCLAQSPSPGARTSLNVETALLTAEVLVMAGAHFVYYLKNVKVRNLIYYKEDYFARKEENDAKAREAMAKKTDGDEPPPGLLRSRSWEDGRFRPIIR